MAEAADVLSTHAPRALLALRATAGIAGEELGAESRLPDSHPLHSSAGWSVIM